jgi:cardiolipin synthase
MLLMNYGANATGLKTGGPGLKTSASGLNAAASGLTTSGPGLNAGASGLKIDRTGAHWSNPLRTAPNLMTLFRLCLAPFLVIAVLERRFALAFALFVMAATTDAMDGLVARWLRQRTRIGQYLDPIADKLLLSSLFLVLTYMGILEPHVAAIVFSRDLGMLLVAVILYAITDLRDFHPTFLGKANSFSQVVAIGMVLLSLIPDQSWDQPWVSVAKAAAVNTTILLTVLSGFHYGWVVSQRIGVAHGPATRGGGESGIRGIGSGRDSAPV